MKQKNVKTTLSLYMESLESNLDLLPKKIEKLVTLILEKIENKGKIYFISTGFTNSLITHFFELLDCFPKVDYIKNIINIIPGDSFPQFLDEDDSEIK